jgi:hypothetical protein
MKYRTGDKLRPDFLKRSLSSILITASVLYASTAIITLEMPVGGRQLGMGETGVALADDATATYYNPAGLAFGPLADEWEVSRKEPSAKGEKSKFTAMTSRGRSGFLVQPDIWAGTSQGILHFNGKEWRDFHSVIIEGEVRIFDILRRFTGREDGLDSLVQRVREYNKITSIEEEKLLVEIRIPWNIVVNRPVTAMVYEDRTDKLWLGTTKGLLRFDGKGFKDFKYELGEPHITSLTTQGANIWVGTTNGLYHYARGEFSQKGKVLPSQHISAVKWAPMRQELYVAVQGAGIARLVPKKGAQDKDKWSLFNMEDGILDLDIRELIIDSSGHVWSAHKEGLSHFNLRKWEQVRFEKNEVHSLAVDESGAIWIGTNRGVWKHLPAYATAKGRKIEAERAVEEKGEWTHFHSGNGLSHNRIDKIEVQGKDVWFATPVGIERFNKAGNQVSFFYEKLLPALEIPDLYHLYLGSTFPVNEWGTVGMFVNFVSFGSTTLNSDLNENDPETFNSSEIVTGLSYGTRLSKKWGLGLNFKFFYSSLSSGAATGEPDAKTGSYAVDLGVLGKNLLIEGLNFGAVLANMGPNVYYIDKSNDDPIPLEWRIAMAYDLIRTVDHRLLVAVDYNREMVYEDDRGKALPFYISSWKAWGYPSREQPGDSKSDVFMKSIKEGVINTGMEYTYANTLALRAGFLHDQLGSREELDIGLGILISDILQVDWATIRQVGVSEGVRDGQQRFSLLFKF